jgi:hypothetical protein
MIAEQTDHNINGGSLSFDLSSADYSNRVNVYASFQHIARKSYYGSKQDPDAYGRTHDLTVATGAQYIHSFDRLWFLPADLTLGVEYNYNDLDDESIGYDYRTKQKVHIIGAYLQNEWKNEHWSLLIGGRLDKHSLVDHVIFSPRANLRYNPGEGASLRLSYSSGFRAPQAFDEDMHIAIVGGERVRIRLADDLREERSHSLSLSEKSRPTCSSKVFTRRSTTFSPCVRCPIRIRTEVRSRSVTTARAPASWASISRVRPPSPVGSTCRPESPSSRAATRNRNSGAKIRRSHRPARCSARRTPTATLRPN